MLREIPQLPSIKTPPPPMPECKPYEDVYGKIKRLELELEESRMKIERLELQRAIWEEVAVIYKDLLQIVRARFEV